MYKNSKMQFYILKAFMIQLILQMYRLQSERYADESLSFSVRFRDIQNLLYFYLNFKVKTIHEFKFPLNYWQI